MVRQVISLTVSHPTEVTPNHPNNFSSNAKPEPSYAQAVAAASQRFKPPQGLACH